jgi:pimeloyl-ACP methyl ester carboxylesterase
MTPTSHVVPVNGLNYRYLRWGEDHRPAVLLLHGLRSYAHTWEPVAEALSATRLVIAPDFRGRGESDWDPGCDYHTDTYVRDIEVLTDSLGLKRFDIIGHSMGGAVGYTYAARHPDRVDRLIIEDIGPGSSTDTAGADRIVREMKETPAGFDSLDAVRAYWRGIRPDITETALDSRIRHTVRQTADGRWLWRLDMSGIAAARVQAARGAGPDLWACVAALRCPTLVIRGACSDFLPADTCVRMAERQPLLEWSQVSAAGHYVHDDNPAEFIRLVTDFLGAVR